MKRIILEVQHGSIKIPDLITSPVAPGTHQQHSDGNRRRDKLVNHFSHSRKNDLINC